MQEGRQEAIAEVVTFIKTHPGVDLRVTDRNSEGQLTVGENDALMAEFGNVAMLVDRHGNQFRLTEESVITIRDSVGMEALAAAGLAETTNPQRKPRLNEPRPEYNHLLEPINQSLIPALAILLRRFKDIVMGVVDLKESENGEGRLCLGENQTLQAEFGKNAFAVQEHPDRFQLTEGGVAAYLQAQRDIEEDDLRNANAEDGTHEYLHDAIAAVQRSRQEKQRQAFEAKFEDLVVHGDFMSRTSHLIISGLQRSQVQELRQAAGSAGFIITNNHSKTPRSNLLAISGDDVADIIRRVLKKQCYGGEIEKIKDYDREGVGVYAILFDINNGQLLIYNKDMFLNKKP